MKPSFSVLNPHAAGIDIGAGQHFVCVGDDPDKDVRVFGTFTAHLQALADWLQQRGVTTVAMESTGVYWVPLFELLDRRGMHVILVDPRQTRRAGRPKTDRLDCQWIRRLHACGLLTAAFRPADVICEFRGYLRLRLTLVKDGARHIQHMEKALELMNVKLVQVVGDITGKTGLSILRAIVAGQRQPQQLAKYRDPRCKHTAAEIALALEGNWRPEHLFALQQAIEAWDFCQGQLHHCDVKLHACLKALPKKRAATDFPVKPYYRRHANAPAFDVRPLLAQMAGVDLTAIEGIDSTVAMVLLAEVGIDVSAFPTEKHFGSWLNVAPRAKASGKRRRDQVGPGASRAAWALRMAAQSLHRSQSALGGFFRRLKGRLGAAKAVTATAYKLARLVYRLLKYGHDYVARGLEEYEATFRERTIRALERKAKAFGFELIPLPLIPLPS
jgi:transposase